MSDKLITVDGLKQYHDTLIKNVVVKRIPQSEEEGSNQDYVYTETKNSGQGYRQLTANNASGTIPLRDTNGNFHIGTPSENTHAASKAYVDSKVKFIEEGISESLIDDIKEEGLYKIVRNDNSSYFLFQSIVFVVPDSDDILMKQIKITPELFERSELADHTWTQWKPITAAAYTEYNGFKGGLSAVAESGGAIGQNASTISGGAVGEGSFSAQGFSGGLNAKTQGLIDAIQLGTGTNSNEKTLQVYDYQLMDKNGNIPVERLSKTPKEIKDLGSISQVEDFNDFQNMGIYTFTHDNETGYLIVLTRQGEDVDGNPALGPYQILIGWDSPSQIYYRYEQTIGEGGWSDLIPFNATLPNNLIYNCNADLNSDYYSPSVDDGTNDIEYNEDGSIYKSNAFKFTSYYIIIQTAYDDYSAIQTKFSADGIFTRSYSEGENGPEWTPWEKQPTILTSPNGTKYKLSVSDSGELITTLVN